MSGAFENPHRRVELAGAPISAVDLEVTTRSLLAAIRERRGGYVCVVDAHSAVNASRDPRHRAHLEQAALCVADGRPLVYLAHALGHHDVGYVMGLELTLSLSAELAQNGGRVAYVGGEAGVADAMAQTLESHYPGMKRALAWSPPFRPLSDRDVDSLATRLREAKAQLAWIGISTPKQEALMHRLARVLAGPPVLVGVGAVFDYLSGRRPAPPAFLRHAGLGWAHRIWVEPRRLGPRYARVLPAFAARAAYQLLRVWGPW